MISCRRGPPAPLATRIRSSGRLPRSASTTGWIPLRMAIFNRSGMPAGEPALLLRQDPQAVIKPVGKVGHRGDQRDLHHLLVVEVMEQASASFVGGGVLRKLAGVSNGCPLALGKALVLAGLEGAHFVVCDARLLPGSYMRRGTEGALIGVGAGEVDQL